MSQVFIINEKPRMRDMFLACWNACRAMTQPMELILRPAKSKRTLEQNAKCWAMLGDIARQMPWVVDGRQQYLSSDEWKDIMTAAMKQEMRVAQGINGGIVLLGRRTRTMSIQDMGDLIELMYAFGAEKGIRWSVGRLEIPTHYEDAA